MNKKRDRTVINIVPQTTNGGRLPSGRLSLILGGRRKHERLYGASSSLPRLCLHNHRCSPLQWTHSLPPPLLSHSSRPPLEMCSSCVGSQRGQCRYRLLKPLVPCRFSPDCCRTLSIGFRSISVMVRSHHRPSFLYRLASFLDMRSHPSKGAASEVIANICPPPEHVDAVVIPINHL